MEWINVNCPICGPSFVGDCIHQPKVYASRVKNPEYLIAAKDMLGNAKKDLCLAISAFNKTGEDFERTTDQIKQMIGDIECAIFELDNQ